MAQFKVTFSDTTALKQRFVIVNFAIPEDENTETYDEFIMDAAIGELEKRDGVDGNDLEIFSIEDLSTGEKLEY